MSPSDVRANDRSDESILQMSSGFLFVPMSWGRGIGPIREMIALAKALIAYGADVAFAVKPEFSANVIEAGIAAPGIIPGASRPPVNEEFFLDFPAFQGLADEDRVVGILEAEAAAVNLFRPSAVVSYLQPTCAITSHRFGLPHISLARWTEHPRFGISDSIDCEFKPPASSSTTLFNRLLMTENQPPVDDVWHLCYMRSDMKLAPSIPEIEPGLADVDDLHFVGYFVGLSNTPKDCDQGVRRWAASERRRIYCYTSAKELLVRDYLPLVESAAESLDLEILVATGHDSSVGRGYRNDRVYVADWVPGDYVLRHADAVVTVGTRTTCMQAAMAGAGIVCFPSADFELIFFSSQLANVEAAWRLTSLRPSLHELMQAMNSALEGPIRQGSRLLGDVVRAAGGPNRAAELILSTYGK